MGRVKRVGQRQIAMGLPLLYAASFRSVKRKSADGGVGVIARRDKATPGVWACSGLKQRHLGEEGLGRGG